MEERTNPLVDTCAACNGLGHGWITHHLDPCPACGGTGEVVLPLETTLRRVPCGYLRHSGQRPAMLEVRDLTLAEAKNLSGRSRVKVLDRSGGWRDIKVNGAPKTWKTRPGDVRIPVKYGLYEHGYVVFHNGEMDPVGWQMVVPYQGPKPVTADYDTRDQEG